MTSLSLAATCTLVAIPVPQHTRNFFLIITIPFVQTHNWAEDKRWTPSMDTEKRDRLYRLWKKAVTRTLDWVDEDVEAASA